MPNVNTQAIALILTCLESIKADWDAGDFYKIRTDDGLCGNTRSRFVDIARKDPELSKVCGSEVIEYIAGEAFSWPQHSGNSIFPVPSYQEGVSPGEAYMARNLYEAAGPYEKARYDLLCFLISRLKENLL